MKMITTSIHVWSALEYFILFILFSEAMVVALLEAFIVKWHIDFITTHCDLSRTNLGESQTDLIYHGMLITMQIYQCFLCIDALRQRSRPHLYAFYLFGTEGKKKKKKKAH